MKFKSLIWLSGIALIILIFVQYYFISETFHTKQEQFDAKYKGLSKLGLLEFENKYRDIEQDSIFNLMDDVAYFALADIGFTDSENARDSIKQIIFEEFELLLNQSLIRTAFLIKYFKEAGEPPAFKTHYTIQNLQLLSFDNIIPVYNDTLIDAASQQSASHVLSSYTVERNYFRAKYNFNIVFTKRQEQIDREMILTKSLSITTLFIVFAIFFFTLRNLWIQRRMSEMKTDFINNMTHELKTPLSTISVASSSLALNDGQLSDERVREISSIIKKQNKHLTKLIDRILDISIWEKDQVRIDEQKVNLNHFINEIAEDFETTNANVSFELYRKNIDEKTYFEMDEVHMNTVLNNLLGNAIKYGGKPPMVKMEIVLNSALEIAVSDNGSGIPRNEQDHIFDKFFRGKHSKERVVKGLGLGLFYVKQIVEAHQGSVWIEESTPKGSTFKIKIPS